MQLNIYQAKAQFSALLERAKAGEEIVIAKAGKPVAKLVGLKPPASSRSGVRFGGLAEAELGLSDDFNEPLTDNDLLGFDD